LRTEQRWIERECDRDSGGAANHLSPPGVLLHGPRMHESSTLARYDLVAAVTILQMPGGGTRRNPARIASRSGLEQKAVRQRENFRGGMSFAP